MNKFLAYWCCDGLESITDITEYADWDTVQAFDRLADNEVKNNPIDQQISHMKLRAQFNLQRSYELYGFTSELTRDELEDLWDSDPQAMVNWLRENGVKIHSDRREPNPHAIV